MKDTSSKTLTREELAEHLLSLAKQLKKGELLTDDRIWSVPQELSTKIKIKEKKGRISYRLTCKWSTLPDYGPEDRTAVDQWKQSMKSVKKTLAASFARLNKEVKADSLPSETTMRQLNESSGAMAHLADPEWQDAMQIYMDHLENLNHAVESGQKAVILHEVGDLRNCMKSCHREFK